VNKELAADVSKLAGLGDVPILGPLFRSKNYRSGRTDLVIFVTPTVIDPSSSINQGQLQKASEIEQKYDSLIGNKEGVNPMSPARGILN
jgi:pilus assembly protein CpaC